VSQDDLLLLIVEQAKEAIKPLRLQFVPYDLQDAIRVEKGLDSGCRPAEGEDSILPPLQILCEAVLPLY
jgi:hypothetical protein